MVLLDLYTLIIVQTDTRSHRIIGMNATPRQHGFRMPAEWEPHEATWLAWPHHKDDWPDKFAAIPWVYTEIVRQLHESEIVRILVQGSRGETSALTCLKRLTIDLGRVELHRVPTNRVWTRDYGPLFVKQTSGKIGAVHWAFNAWAKYPNWQRDQAAFQRLLAERDVPTWLPRIDNRRVVLEGGSIDVNGTGLLVTTEECLLSDVQQRNPDLTRAEYERLFSDYLHVDKVLWLGRGIVGDDTHGHVDDLARFVGPGTLVTVVEKDTADPNYHALQENWDRLRAATDLDGKPLDVVALPMPAPVYFDGQRLPASYANFYIANDRVLVPTFNDPNDRKALGILADLFPGRKVIGIHAVDLVWGLGTLHCLTQQQPAAMG
jgi:agmatine deiminase